MNVALVLGASIGLQLIAAFLALRLIRVTRRRTAWMLIAIAIFLMALRRGITLFHLLTEDLSYAPDLSAEVVALIISLLMVFGIAWIAPLFLSIRSSEETLREERDKAQKYLDVAGVMFVAIDANQKVTLINQKGCEILGYEEQDIIGKNWFDNFLPKQVRQEVKSVFSRLMMGEIEPVEYFENAILTKNGKEKKSLGITQY